MQEKTRESDEELVILIRDKDKERYVELVERYEEKLMRYSTYLLHDNEKAADVVQESFIKAYVNLNSFNPQKKFSSWIYRIVHNEAMNAIKKYYKESPMSEKIDYKSDTNIEEELTKKEVIEEAQGCLAKLPILYREPLALFYLDDKSYADISDILRIPMGTVATRVNRAKKVMKKICQENK